jgi:hypothetical protein
MLPIAHLLFLVQVTSVIQRADPSLTRVEILQRAPASDTLDAVVALGSDRNRANRRLVLLLQNRNDPGLTYLLGIEPGILNCAPRVERVSATDVVGSCEGENYELRPNWKFRFDPGAKKMLQFFTYMPFSARRIFRTEHGAAFLASNTEELQAVEYQPDRNPAFRVLSSAEMKSWTTRVRVITGTIGMPPRQVIAIDPDKSTPPEIPLPRTTYDEFAKARPERVGMGYVRAGTELQVGIGPWKEEDGRIWFGKSFYDGEGSSGVGGFGYFERSTGKYKLYSPPEIADYSVSAISVSPADIWMGLFWFGEGASPSGGLLRFDRRTGTVQRLPLRDVALEIDRLGDRILAATSSGIAVIENGIVRRFLLDRMNDGHWRVLEAR